MIGLRAKSAERGNMRRRGAVAKQKTGKVKRVLKSGTGAGKRTGRSPLGGGVVPVSKPTKRRKQRKPAKPKMRVGKRGK